MPTYFVFNVLQIGMSISPYILTKWLKPVINYWRSAGRTICMLLDDELNGNSCKESAPTDAMAVGADLVKLGFLLNVVMCAWDPSLIQTCSSRVINELQFWHNKVSELNGKDLFDKIKDFDPVFLFREVMLSPTSKI